MGRDRCPRPQIDHIRKPQLLAAAAEVISERGLSATRVADVAEQAGAARRPSSTWFRSKDELLTSAHLRRGPLPKCRHQSASLGSAILASSCRC